eukprot:3930302-Rhodomonas_salina.1
MALNKIFQALAEKNELTKDKTTDWANKLRKVNEALSFVEKHTEQTITKLDSLMVLKNAQRMAEQVSKVLAAFASGDGLQSFAIQAVSEMIRVEEKIEQFADQLQNLPETETETEQEAQKSL